MPGNHEFHFKQFSIRQDRCAMKVTSDACIFGAWVDVTGSRTILDVGTGTGLLALMAAQRCSAVIDAVEIDEGAANQARENIQNSPWKDRIAVHHTSFQQFTVDSKPEKRYDCVICNPPFYKDSLLPKDRSKQLAWHSEALRLEEVIQGCFELMKQTATINLLLAIQDRQRLEGLCCDSGLFIRQFCLLQPQTNRSPHRIMVSLNKLQCQPIEDKVVIYDDYGGFSLQSKQMLQSYFLKI